MDGVVSFDTLKVNPLQRDAVDRLGLAHRSRSMQCPDQKAHQHGDQTIAVYVFQSWRTWHCHVCGAGGSVIDLWPATLSMTLVESDRALAESYGLDVDGDVLKPQPRPITMLDALLRPTGPDVPAALEKSQQTLTWSHHAKQCLEGARLSTWCGRKGWPRIRPKRLLVERAGSWTISDHCSGDHSGRDTPDALRSEHVLLRQAATARLSARRQRDLQRQRATGRDRSDHQGRVRCPGRPRRREVCAALCGLSMREAWWQEIAAKTIVLAVDAEKVGQRRGEELTKQAGKAGKQVIRIETAELEGHADLSEYWAAKKELPGKLR